MQGAAGHCRVVAQDIAGHCRVIRAGALQGNAGSAAMSGERVGRRGPFGTEKTDLARPLTPEGLMGFPGGLSPRGPSGASWRRPGAGL